MFKENFILSFILLLNGFAYCTGGVRCLIFDNTNNTVTIDFNDRIIIENVFLLKKTKESDSVPVTSLNGGLVSPPDYFEKVETFQQTPKTSKKYKQIMESAETNQLTIELPTELFDSKTTYLFKIQQVDEDNALHSEEFVYNDNKFVHKSDSSGRGWYASSWPWIAIGFIILCALLLLKILFC